MRTNVFNFEQHAERLRAAIDKSGSEALSQFYVYMCCECAKRNSGYVLLNDRTMRVVNRLLREYTNR